MSTEKEKPHISSSQDNTDIDVGTVAPANDHEAQPLPEAEVFGVQGEGQIEFRTVGWVRASMFLIKQTFATGVLSIPSAMYYMGSVASCISIVFWGLLNAFLAYEQVSRISPKDCFYCLCEKQTDLGFFSDEQGQFKLAHPKMHTIVDGAEMTAFQLSGGSRAWARSSRGLAEVLYILSWLLCIGLAVLAVGTAFNAITGHGTCTVAFNVVSFVIFVVTGSVRKIHGLGIILWVGFVSSIVSVLIVVVAVAVRERPAYAPPTGPYELGFQALPPAGTTFAQAWAASVAIYSSSSNTCGYLPVMSEMRRPGDFFKSLWVCAGFVTSAYLSLATVVYAYCGKWVTSPSLGSGGERVKVAAYAVALPGLIAVGMICVHVPAKSVFVRA